MQNEDKTGEEYPIECGYNPGHSGNLYKDGRKTNAQDIKGEDRYAFQGEDGATGTAFRFRQSISEQCLAPATRSCERK
jgi:hypothetical protein